MKDILIKKMFRYCYFFSYNYIETMVLTKEQRLEILKRAREAKKAKSDAKKQEKKDNPPPKGRPKKKIEEKTLELDLNEDVKTQPLADYSEPEIEEIVEVRKIPKKKKIIRKRIIQEYESGTDEEIEEIVEAPIRKTKPQQAKVKPDERPVELEKPREVDITQSTPQFNIFDY